MYVMYVLCYEVKGFHNLLTHLLIRKKGLFFIIKKIGVSVRLKMGSNNFADPEQTQHFGRGVTASQKATIRAFDKFYSMFPSFLDIFPDEDAFLSFAFWFVLTTLVTAFILSRYITIKPQFM